MQSTSLLKPESAGLPAFLPQLFRTVALQESGSVRSRVPACRTLCTHPSQPTLQLRTNLLAAKLHALSTSHPTQAPIWVTDRHMSASA